jgi:hypothetical protein
MLPLAEVWVAEYNVLCVEQFKKDSGHSDTDARILIGDHNM